jgi:hypothetical protein
LDSY